MYGRNDSRGFLIAKPNHAGGFKQQQNKRAQNNSSYCLRHPSERTCFRFLEDEMVKCRNLASICLSSVNQSTSNSPDFRSSPQKVYSSRGRRLMLPNGNVNLEGNFADHRTNMGREHNLNLPDTRFARMADGIPLQRLSTNFSPKRLPKPSSNAKRLSSANTLKTATPSSGGTTRKTIPFEQNLVSSPDETSPNQIVRTIRSQESQNYIAHQNSSYSTYNNQADSDLDNDANSESIMVLHSRDQNRHSRARTTSKSRVVKEVGEVSRRSGHQRTFPTKAQASDNDSSDYAEIPSSVTSKSHVLANDNDSFKYPELTSALKNVQAGLTPEQRNANLIKPLGKNITLKIPNLVNDNNSAKDLESSTNVVETGSTREQTKTSVDKNVLSKSQSPKSQAANDSNKYLELPSSSNAMEASLTRTQTRANFIQSLSKNGTTTSQDLVDDNDKYLGLKSSSNAVQAGLTREQRKGSVVKFLGQNVTSRSPALVDDKEPSPSNVVPAGLTREQTNANFIKSLGKNMTSKSQDLVDDNDKHLEQPSSSNVVQDGLTREQTRANFYRSLSKNMTSKSQDWYVSQADDNNYNKYIEPPYALTALQASLTHEQRKEPQARNSKKSHDSNEDNQDPREVVLQDSYYFNDSMFDEPSQYGNNESYCPGNNFIDPTYQSKVDDMNLYVNDLFIAVLDSKRDRNGICNYCDFEAGAVTSTNQLVGPDRNNTKIQEIQSSLNAQNCKPYPEQSKASIFRIILHKLSHIYRLMFSYVASQK